MRKSLPSEHDARVRLTQVQAEQLVLRTVATEGASLLRTAHRHSLCADDAYDAYQRGMEIFMRRAQTLDPQRVGRWLHVVVKHEARAVRASRSRTVAAEDLDYELHASQHTPGPEERAIDGERVSRAAEALRRLKPDELRAMWMKASGKSYMEIATELDWSRTKVNRALAEGRKSFLERFAGIESGEECERWQPLLSALVDGEASPEALADLRPHLRRCTTCRATVRTLHEAGPSLGVVLPFGLLGVGAKFAGLLERVLPVAGPADAVTTAGGAGLLGVGGAKLAGLLAAGAATAGGGLVVADVHHQRSTRSPSATAATAARGPVSPAGVAADRSAGAALRPTATASVAPASLRSPAPRLVARRDRATARMEFAPAGGEPTAAAAPNTARAAAAVVAQPSASPRDTPASPSSPDSASGEFAPQP